MSARRLLMRKIREVLRLKHEQGLSHQAVVQACAVGVGTVNRYLQRAAQCGLVWPVAGRAERRGARGPIVSASRAGARPDPARLRAHPPRAQARRDHAAVVVGGVRPGPSGRLPPLPVLRESTGNERGGSGRRCGRCTEPERRRSSTSRQAANAGRPTHG